MTDLEWLFMAAKCAAKLPDLKLDWKYIRYDDDKVIFAYHTYSPYIGDKDGLNIINVTDAPFPIPVGNP